MIRRPGGDDAGFATVLAAGIATVLVLLLGMVLALGAAMVSRREAETAADDAALAAAADAVLGRELACDHAGAVASSFGARVVECSWVGWDVSVRTQRSAGWPLGDLGGPAAGRARAGPLGLAVPPGVSGG